LTLTLYADFACGYCRRLSPLLEELSARYRPDLRLVYLNLPHSEHELSLRLGLFAQAALSLGGPEAFWRVYDEIYPAQGELGDSQLTAIANAAGLPPAALIEASRKPALTPELEEIAEQAEEFGIDGTPTLLINGKRYDGLVPRATLARALAEEARYVRELARHGIPRSHIYDALCPTAPQSRPGNLYLPDGP
jgi:protein-disulfide isomerase